MTDVKSAIYKLERDYTEHKEKFERWKFEHSAFARQPEYNAYVESFLVWERSTLDQLKELRSSIVRQPVVPEPQLPTVSLDTQLNETLLQTSPQEFIMAFITMTQKDLAFLKKSFEVVMHETKGTWLPNQIHQQSSVSSYIDGKNLSSQPPSYFSTASYQQKSAPYSSAVNQQFSQGYSQSIKSIGDMIHYGVIPEGWAVNPSIKKASKSHSPLRDYRRPLNLPFKDFSQS